MPTVLHVGCGATPLPDMLTGFAETRLDIDPGVSPDIVASMTALGEIGPFDAVYSSHSLEHLYPHETGQALAEFYRVLRPGGAAIIFVPDLEGVEPTEDVLFVSPGGPITGFDMIYGKRDLIEETSYMAHHSGFVSATLAKALEDAGFREIRTLRGDFNLLGLGYR